MDENRDPKFLTQRYLLLQEIGRGGMGEVHRARDRSLERESALKLLHRKLREDERFKGIPVIIITGISDDFKKFISSRKHIPAPNGYISKPVDADEFLKKVKELIG